ncbi:regulator of G-protein signaling 9-binding protein-like [Phascolarctos cinereus]|uniref:Regulator of G-protein signaling 9-binding protein-like n=1 Tax=Phascolarctos cinereus TaxID=38626 RepID=A0A6P5IH83_PHACI|nr:regulator of G-protein signaling 9-binding protein-like [Phascolarctos cinereus]
MRGAGPGERAREAREAVAECRAAYEALNRFTASYRQLVLGVGSSADGRRLRRALEDSGRRGFELSLGLRNQLLAELTEPGGRQEEEVKMELERIWVLCLSALEIFLQDLGRAHDLSQLFPLPSLAPETQLVNTGVTSFGPKGWSLRRPSGKASERARELPEELAQWGQRLEEMLVEMETKVNVPVWSVEATVDSPGAEEPSLEGSAGRSPRGCCARAPLRLQSHCIVA